MKRPYQFAYNKKEYTCILYYFMGNLRTPLGIRTSRPRSQGGSEAAYDISLKMFCF